MRKKSYDSMENTAYLPGLQVEREHVCNDIETLQSGISSLEMRPSYVEPSEGLTVNNVRWELAGGGDVDRLWIHWPCW